MGRLNEILMTGIGGLATLWAVACVPAQENSVDETSVPPAAKSGVNAPEADDTRDRAEAEFIIQGVLNRIERIHTGDVRMKMFAVDPDGRLDPGSTYRTTFDRDRNRIRYEHTHHARGGFRTITFVRSDSKCLQHVESSSSRQKITLHPADYVPEIPEARPIDLRTVGLVGHGEVCYGADLEWCRQFYWLNLSLFHTVAVERGGEGDMTRLRLDHRDARGADFRVEVLIDEHKQYTPIELTNYYRSPQEEGLRRVTTDTTTWRQMAGVWIPETWMVERGIQRPLRYEFTWDSVNEELDPQLFELEGMGLPDGTLIVNRMLGRQGIIEGRLGEPPLRFAAPPPLPIELSKRPRLALWINLALFAAGLGLMVWRRWKTIAVRRSS